MLESRVVGMLDFHTGSANQGFRTVHLKLLRLISGYLAIIVSRDALARSARVLEDQKAGLVDATIHHHRRDAMLYRVLQLRESSHAGYDQYLTSVLSAICNGIPCAVGVVLVLSGDGKVVAEVSNGLERAMLRRLRTLLSAAQDAVREVGFYSRAFRRESEAAKVRPVKFLMASHVPMQDNQYALVALAKGEGEREFSTAEREAMEVACALVRFPNKVPHQEPRATRVREGSVR
jgi:hypothetical protein